MATKLPKWLKDKIDRKIAGKEIPDAKTDALMVFVTCPAIRAWLLENDPKALEQAEKALFDGPKFHPLDKSCGSLFTKKDFLESVKSGSFIDYDGFGRLATATEESDICIIPSDIFVYCAPAFKPLSRGRTGLYDWPKWATHVMWYNR